MKNYFFYVIKVKLRKVRNNILKINFQCLKTRILMGGILMGSREKE